MYHVPLPFQCIYECGEGGENGDRKKGSESPGESGDYLDSCMQMTRFVGLLGKFVEVCSRRDLRQ